MGPERAATVLQGEWVEGGRDGGRGGADMMAHVGARLRGEGRERGRSKRRTRVRSVSVSVSRREKVSRSRRSMRVSTGARLGPSKSWKRLGGGRFHATVHATAGGSVTTWMRTGTMGWKSESWQEDVDIQPVDRTWGWGLR